MQIQFYCNNIFSDNSANISMKLDGKFGLSSRSGSVTMNLFGSISYKSVL